MFTTQSLAKIIHCTLTQITATRHPLWSQPAEDILIMAAAHESQMGRYLKQIGGGPARGIMQVEAGTMVDNYRNFIDQRPVLASQIAQITGCKNAADLEALTYNPLYNIIHARLKLYRSPGEIPDDTYSMALYLKEHYNTRNGSATPDDYLRAYYAARQAAV